MASPADIEEWREAGGYPGQVSVCLQSALRAMDEHSVTAVNSLRAGRLLSFLTKPPDNAMLQRPSFAAISASAHREGALLLPRWPAIPLPERVRET